MSSKKDIYNPFFSHLYVEKEILEHNETKRILSLFPNAKVIEINQYMDIFGRRHQNYANQQASPKLILAGKKGQLVYPGSKNCQSFDHDYFYYTSNMMNCIYDCEYCYLKGMYPCGNLVYFVNLEDTFLEIENLLKEHPVYVCIAYDSDLLAVENIFHIVERWQEFAQNKENLVVEVRTKCGNQHVFERLSPMKSMIYAFTISPEKVTTCYEHKTSSLQQRLDCIHHLQQRGFQTRLCFDPMIYFKGWEAHYAGMLQACREKLDFQNILDCSVGSFRISQDYMKNMKKIFSNSSITAFPYETIRGVYQYPLALQQKMKEFMCHVLRQLISPDKIFCWEDQSE